MKLIDTWILVLGFAVLSGCQSPRAPSRVATGLSAAPPAASRVQRLEDVVFGIWSQNVSERGSFPNAQALEQMSGALPEGFRFSCEGNPGNHCFRIEGTPGSWIVTHDFTSREGVADPLQRTRYADPVQGPAYRWAAQAGYTPAQRLQLTLAVETMGHFLGAACQPTGPTEEPGDASHLSWTEILKDFHSGPWRRIKGADGNLFIQSVSLETEAAGSPTGDAVLTVHLGDSPILRVAISRPETGPGCMAKYLLPTPPG